MEVTEWVIIVADWEFSTYTEIPYFHWKYGLSGMELYILIIVQSKLKSLASLLWVKLNDNANNTPFESGLLP